ncbi:kinesin-related protein 3-like [Octopus sinensis]|uniref:Kinesin-related protein 3-like n=1 Tax=Octopus sinensis TaxID=2607531 RepID=A0A7E6F8D6_9MOLL|nr:kinesin-related protein 3-like [Octopus sinensis]
MFVRVQRHREQYQPPERKITITCLCLLATANVPKTTKKSRIFVNQSHIYQGSFFHSLEKGLAGHRQPDTFGQTLKQSKRAKKLALPEKRNDVRKLRVSERTSSGSSSNSGSSSSNSGSSSSSGSSGSSSGGDSSSGGGSSSVDNKYESNTASHFTDSKSKQDKVNTDRGFVEAPVKTITEEANDDHENVEVSTAQHPVDNNPRAPDFNENSALAEDDSKEDNENFQYETDLQRTSVGEKNFSNGFPVLPIKKEKPVRVAQRPDLSGTQDEEHISIKQELQDDDQLADTQMDSEKNASVELIKIHKSTGISPQNKETDREDRDWVGVGHAKQVVTSASKTVPHKSSKEILSSVNGQNLKESHKKGKEVGLPLQLPIYSHRRLVPRRTNRTKEILSSKNISLQSAAKNTANMEDKVHRTHQQMSKERRLISHRRKPVMNIPKTKAAETVTQMASKDQDSNNDEKALMSLVSHLNTNSKQHKQ